MTVVFMGTPEYATTIFKELLTCKDIHVPLVVSQPDKPVGRKQVLTAPHIKKYIQQESLHVEVFQPINLRSNKAYEKIKNYSPDFIIVAAFGQILPKNILDIAPCINLHASLLPLYRGASPIQSSIIQNDSYSGVTAMLMEEGLDCGDILGFSYCKLDKDKKVDVLFEELSFLAAKLCVKTLKNFSELLPLKQNNCESSYAKKIKKSDGVVDFEHYSAQQIYNKYRTYDPWPGIFLPTGMKLKALKRVQFSSDLPAGSIVKIDKEYIYVQCKEDSVAIKILQVPSKKAIPAVDYVRGKRMKVGSLLV